MASAQAGSLTAAPASLPADAVSSEVQGLQARGLSVILVASNPDLEPLITSVAEQTGAGALWVDASDDDPTVLSTIAAEGGSGCAIRLSGGLDALEGHLAGDCLGTRLPLSPSALTRFHRIGLYEATRPESPLADVPLDAEATQRLSRKKAWNKTGRRLALGGGALVAGTTAWYFLANRASDPLWTTMQVVNGVGWVGVAGGGAALIGARTIRVDGAGFRGVRISGRF